MTLGIDSTLPELAARLHGMLRARKNNRALVFARSSALQDGLHCSFEDLRTALAQLSDAGLVEILSPLPYAVLALRPQKLPGISTPLGSNRPVRSGQSSRSQEEVPVSSSFAAAAIQSREVGGAGEGEALLRDVLAALGSDIDRSEVVDLIARYSPALIRRCLRRVQATPRIKVSKAALFRHLLVKLSR